jgi:SagB-type dehydrogenase family enzyme
MLRKDLDYIVIAAMFLSGLYVAITGLVMDLFGLHRVALHPFAGYTFAALVGLHLILNWSRVTAYVRRKLQPGPSRERPARHQPAPSLGRRELLFSLLGAMGGFILGGLIRARRVDQLADETGVKFPQADVGTFYHQWSKPGYSSLKGAILNWGGEPKRYKSYPEAERIALPDPHDHQGLSLDETIEKRRSIRDYTAGPMNLDELSRLLHTAQGITDQRRGFRAVPSAGALYPIETYALVHNVAELQPGLYHYAMVDHTLEQLRIGDLRRAIVVAGIGQDMLGQAQVCFALSAIFQRTRWKYHERTYRYVMLEAGHIGQNLYLTATSMGLGACAVGAFLDDDLNRLLGLDGQEEAALYLMSVGKT